MKKKKKCKKRKRKRRGRKEKDKREEEKRKRDMALRRQEGPGSYGLEILRWWGIFCVGGFSILGFAFCFQNFGYAFSARVQPKMSSRATFGPKTSKNHEVSTYTPFGETERRQAAGEVRTWEGQEAEGEGQRKRLCCCSRGDGFAVPTCSSNSNHHHNNSISSTM